MPRHLDPDSRALPKAATTSPNGSVHHFADSLAVQGGSTRQRQDDFLLTASHVLQNPHNYTPRHGHSTRYKEWYSSTFHEDAGRLPRRQRQSESQAVVLLLLTLLTVAIAWLMFPGARGGGAKDAVLFAGLNASVRSEIEGRFSEMDASQKALQQQLHSIQMQMSSEDSLSALAKLRQELDKLTANASSASASDKGMESTWSSFEDEFAQAGALSTGLDDGRSLDDNLQSTMLALKEQIAALASSVQDYSSVTKSLQDKELSSGKLSPEVIDRVKGMVRSAVLEHWLLDSNGHVRAEVKSELRKDVQDSTATSQQEAVESRVRAAVSAAVNSNAPSKVDASVTSALQRIISEKLSGVDWLLAINGARVVQSSPSFDPCQGEDLLSRMSCSAKNSLATPVQLNVNTILKPDGISPAFGDDANGLRLGQCWAMDGSNGFVEIQLDRPVRPRAVVIEHAPASISIGGGESALKNFRVLGWNTRVPGADKVLLVADEYKLTSTSDTEWLTPHIQSFPVNATAVSDVDRISFEVLSNHGHQRYTCIYHVRLLGASFDKASSA